jgi:hypothetical protein
VATLRRALALWLVLFAAYGLAIAGDHRVTPDEARRALVAESIVTDGDLDVADDARGSAVRGVHPNAEGRTLAPVGTGLGLLTAPAWAVAGDTGVRLWLAAITALGFCLAAALARRLVPEPWASASACVAGLSPPAIAAATSISPEGAGATILAGAALLALRARDEPRAVLAFWSAALLSMLPWIGLELLAPAVVVSLALARWLRRRRRGLTGFIALEVVLTSGVVFVTLHERLYGDITPYGADPTGAATVADHLARWPRAIGLLIDRDAGLLRWAPVFGLAALGMALLVRSRRDRLARVISSQIDVEVAATFLVVLVAAVAGTAVFLAPADHGAWLGPRELVPALPAAAALGAWGLRFAPRIGAALALITLAASAWLLAGVVFGDATLRPPHGPLPWAGAEQVLPAIRRP